MKKALLLLLACFTISLYAQETDEFGYRWIDSNDSLEFDWIDITQRGKLIQGLADDNSAGMFDIDMEFRFYWGDFNKVKIGSNGWLSFGNVSNIASCFDPIPTLGGDGDLLVCPLLSDLNFANGSAGEVYYLKENTPGKESFIVSYINVPHWTATDPIFGSNTFQVIFSAEDSSITFQYLDVNADFEYTCTGSGKIGVGIENVTGGIGLNPISGIMPPNEYAIKFLYPDEVLIEVTDIGPLENNNIDNEGRFILPDQDAELYVNVINAGNTDVTGNSTLFMEMLNVFSQVEFSSEQEFGPLAIGESISLFSNSFVDYSPGPYTFRTRTEQADDINATNDINETEVGVLDLSNTDIDMRFAYEPFNTGTITWPGADNFHSGGGVVMTPPGYPTDIISLSVYVAAGGEDFRLIIYDDNGDNGGPGDALAGILVPFGDYVIGWNEYQLPNNVTIEDGRFYIAWLMGGTTMSMGTENTAPYSNSGFEIIEDGWAKYREGATSDIMLYATVQSDFAIATVDPTTNEDILVFPNPAQGELHLLNASEGDIKSVKIYSEFGQLILSEKTNITLKETKSWDISTYQPGIYIIEMTKEDGERSVQKLIII